MKQKKNIVDMLPLGVGPEIENTLQRIETRLDSCSQKLRRINPRMASEIFDALTDVRRLQFRYFPVKTHSLRRYSDSKIRADGSIASRLSKGQWRKYKQLKEMEKQPKISSYFAEIP